MYEAARQLVYEMGVTVSLEDLGFEDVIRRAGVPRSSAYRLWAYKGDFVADLLAYLAGPKWLGTAAFDQETVDLSHRTVAENVHLLADAAGRRAVLQETIRCAVAQNFKAIVESREWHIYVALVATVRTTRGDDAAHAQITFALAASEVEFVRRMESFYKDMFDVFKLRFKRPNIGFGHIATAGAALVEGMALRKVLLDSVLALPIAQMTPQQRDDVRHLQSYIDASSLGPSLTDGQAEWSLTALAFLGLLDAIVEPDPDADTDR